MKIIGTRHRAFRLSAIVALAAIGFTVLMPALPALAQSRWICTFKPMTEFGLQVQESTFYFNSSAQGTDVVQIRAEGTCYNQSAVRPGFGVLVNPASFFGSYVDGSNPLYDMRFGKCDKDPVRSGQLPDRLQVPYMFFDLFIQGVGTFHINLQINGADSPPPQPVFPGPGETIGRLYAISPGHQNDIGTLGLQTRIGGNCPPAGTLNAWYRMDVTLPLP